MWIRPPGATAAIVRVAIAGVLAAGCTGGDEPSALRRKGDPTFTVDPDGILRLAGVSKQQGE